MHALLRFVFVSLFLAAGRLAANDTPAGVPKGYHLYLRDVIRLSIHGEPDLSVERRIDGAGVVSLPLIGTLTLVGLTATEAEEKIAKLYIDRDILVHPNVSVTVSEYSPRELSVLGQVKSPGRITLPIEVEKLSILEAISRAGGLSRIAKGSAVRVTRRGLDGSDQSFTVNVEEMLNGKGAAAVVDVQAEDVIFVPESVF